ncbi:MAG: hypothetical protein CVU05_13075, partial [Bacteroidetes bacterium HGW-Bacteroidetes-21]
TDKTQYFDFRLGYERHEDLGKYFQFYYGIDMLTGYNYTVSHNMSTSQGTPDAISKTIEGGGGPIFGVKFKINPRISIFTETSLYYTYSKRVIDYKFPDSPENNIKELHEAGSINLTTPFFVCLNIAF